MIDNHYIIDGYAYAFKKEIQNNRISLRCQFRTKCAALATVNKNDLLQKLEGKIESFSYSLNKEYKCNGIYEIKKNAVEVNTKANLIAAAKTIIIQNKEKTLGWHISNLKNLNIILSDNKVKRLVYDIKEAHFPKDEDFLKNISQITITFDKNNAKLIENNFCYEYSKFLNPNNNREEKFIIYTTIFQLNKLAVSDLIFIDATFRTSPKHFYQMLNIVCKDRESNTNIPVVHIPMSHKTSFLYEKVFDSINKISKDLGIEINLNKKTCITDFELSLRKILREKYEGIKLRGCFFTTLRLYGQKPKNSVYVIKKIYQKQN